MDVSIIETVDFGHYHKIKPAEETTPEEYIELYMTQFEKHCCSDWVCFLIDIIDLPSVLGVDAFSAILSDADRFNIKHIDMVLATNDNARPIIGAMVKNLSKNFNVTIDIAFLPDLKKAQEYTENCILKNKLQN